MKARVPQGTAFILFETDMKRVESLDESKLTDLQKLWLVRLPDKDREYVLAGQAAAVTSLEDGSTICDFNMENYHPPKHALESLAHALYPSICDYFSNEENRRKFVRDKTVGRRQLKQ